MIINLKTGFISTKEEVNEKCQIVNKYIYFFNKS